MAAQGIALLDFGAFPGASDTSLFVSQPTIASGSLAEAWIFPAVTTDHSADEHIAETLKVFAGNVVASSGFTIYGINTNTLTEPLQAPSPAGSRPAATSVYGGTAPSIGGAGTRLYGKWSIAWVWN